MPLRIINDISYHLCYTTKCISLHKSFLSQIQLSTLSQKLHLIAEKILKKVDFFFFACYMKIYQNDLFRGRPRLKNTVNQSPRLSKVSKLNGGILF